MRRDGLLKHGAATEHNPNATPDAVKNQLGSVFFRWVLPYSALDLYLEYAREDHNANFRDLEMEPDHSRFYTAGFRKMFTRRTDGPFWALRIEYLDASEPSLGKHREEDLYAQDPIRQGHTEDGQVIGAAADVD